MIPGRPKLTLKKAPAAESQGKQPALADPARAARQDQEDAPPPAQGGGCDVETVTVPAAAWADMLKLADLGERVHKGEFKPAAVVDQELATLEQLRQQMQQAMQQHRRATVMDEALAAAQLREQMHQALQYRRGPSSIERVSPHDGPPEAQAAPVTTMDAYVLALRRRPRG
jgi:hypothetical protein